MKFYADTSCLFKGLHVLICILIATSGIAKCEGRPEKNPSKNIISNYIRKEEVHDISKRNIYGQCSSSLETVQIVPECPKNAKEWADAARRKKCSSISQTCTSPENFAYHCLVNEWGNQTLEVCAAKKIIIGFCAEFNMKGERVQEHFKKNCSTVEPPCPSSYESTDAFKYQGCYELLNSQSSTPETKPKVYRSAADKVSSSQLTIWHSFIVVMILIITSV